MNLSIRSLMIITGMVAIISSSPARAEFPCAADSIQLSLWNWNWHNNGGNDLLVLGYVSGYGLMAYQMNASDSKSCFPWFLVNPQGQGLQALSGYSSICTGNGNDEVIIRSSISQTVGGPNAQLCTNLPPMTSFNYNGYAFAVFGENGHDATSGGDGVDLFYGGFGNDSGCPYNGSWNSYWGESDHDSFISWKGGTSLYGDGASGLYPGADDLINYGGHSGSGGGTDFYGGAGNDCIEDMISAASRNHVCGPGSDILAWPYGTPPAWWECETIHTRETWPLGMCSAVLQ